METCLRGAEPSFKKAQSGQKEEEGSLREEAAGGLDSSLREEGLTLGLPGPLLRGELCFPVQPSAGRDALCSISVLQGAAVIQVAGEGGLLGEGPLAQTLTTCLRHLVRELPDLSPSSCHLCPPPPLHLSTPPGLLPPLPPPPHLH